jgi:glutaredoxin
MKEVTKYITGFFIVSIIAIIALYAIYFSLANKIPTNNDTTLNISSDTIVFYYGINCPHCKIVEEFMAETNATQKLKIEQKEVWENKTNQAELISAAKICKLDLNNLGVPMVYYNGTCRSGDVDSIAFLKTMMNGIN